MFKLWLENKNEYIVYHQTSLENAKKIKKYGFSNQKSVFGIFWFSSSVKENSGAAGQGAIIKMSVTINNPAGWDEYEKFHTDQLIQQGFDGVILPEDNGFDGFVFDKNQIRILNVSAVVS